MHSSVVWMGLAVAALAPACAGASDGGVGARRDAITSEAATILDLDFRAEVIAERGARARETIVSQLMYLQGVLMNAGHGNAHIGNVQLASVREAAEGEGKRITYEATLPVAWPKGIEAPGTYELTLPLDATRFDAFNAKYDGRCGKSNHGTDAFWFDYDPKASGCAFDDGDVANVSATVGASRTETEGHYPEYDLVWDDDRLDVVALFGIVSSDAPHDWGYVEARKFVEHVAAQLSGVSRKDNGSSDSIRRDTTLTGTARVSGVAREVRVDVLVVGDLSSAGADFDARYDPLSERADAILYNGHAGLGQIVSAFANKGKVAPGKYQLVLVDGCQTFAYLDTTMSDRRREVNGERDPKGTRFLDVVANALPNPVDQFARVSNVVFDALVRVDEPRSYREILALMPEDQMVVVFGEEDNVFAPR